MAATPRLPRKFGRQLTSNTPLEYSGGKFRATQLWNEVILSLRRNVGIKRRRVKMKFYDGCFSGTDAVDVVYQCLLDENNSLLIQKHISRGKALKLCQALMDNQVFEPIKCDDSKKYIFEDSNNKYFRFIYDDSDEEIDDGSDSRLSSEPEISSQSSSLYLSEYDNGGILDQFRMNSEGEPDMCYSDSILFSSSLVIPKNKSYSEIVQEILTFSTAKFKRLRPRACDIRRRSISPINLFQRNSKSTPESDDCFTSHDLFGRVAQEILQEVALSRLLTLVDLPVLDGLLCTSHKVQSQNIGMVNPGLNISRSSLINHSEVDKWISTAMDCLEYIPKSLKIMEAYISEASEKFRKLELFHGIAEHYRTGSVPLLAEGFVDILVAILNLLMQRNYSNAMRAVQLLLALLPVNIRDEMKRLFSFMQAVVADEITIESGFTNQHKVEQTFTYAIIRNKILAHDQAAVIVMFMLKNQPEIFDIPKLIRDTTLMRLHGLKTGNLQPIYENEEMKFNQTYCTRVSRQEYEEQMEQQTEDALKDLLNSILDDTKITLKEKRNRLKQFQKHHPEIVKKHFPDFVHSDSI